MQSAISQLIYVNLSAIFSRVTDAGDSGADFWNHSLRHVQASQTLVAPWTEANVVKARSW
jgi:hypothetical protein